MKIKGILRRLTTILKNHGNVDVLIDTEAAMFKWHMVDTKAVRYLKKEIAGHEMAYITLDGDALMHVSPPCEHVFKIKDRKVICIKCRRMFPIA